MPSLRSAVALVLTAAVAAASFPAEAAAQVIRAPEAVGPMTVPAVPVSANVPALAPSASLSLSAPALTAGLAAPSAAAALPAAAVAAPAAAFAAPAAVAAAPAALPAAAALPVAASLPAASAPAERGTAASAESGAARAAALFDGSAAAADGPSDADDAVSAAERALAPSPAVRRRMTFTRGLLGARTPSRGALARAGRWLAGATGVNAFWGVYRDGVLVQRWAERLTDKEQAPARRAAAARMLASLGRVEAVPLLGVAAESDGSARVRRAAHVSLLYLADKSEPSLLRTLKRNPFPVSREAAAVSLGWLARHVELPDAVEALGASGLMDRSEGVRRAAITALAGARGAKAEPTLAWMLGVETRPLMRAALERALADARAREPERGVGFTAPVEDLPLAASPLHAAALKSSIAVGLTFATIEFLGGVFTGTLALRADALHLAGDRALDAAALFAMWISRRPPTSRKTYGWLKTEAIFSLLGALGIAAMGAGMVPGVVDGFLHPSPAEGWSVLAFAALSIISNLISAAMLRRHQGEHMGVRGAFLHALSDAVGTFGVMIAAAASLLFGWSWMMPLATAAMVAMVLRVAWELGRPAWNVLLDAVPAGVDMDRLESDLVAVPGVAAVYDLHVRALNSQGAELVAKVYSKPGADVSAILASANAFLRERYGIVHSTIQVEPLPAR